MCGRYASTLTGEELGRYFHADEIADVELRPSWNIAPTTNVPIVVEKRDDRARLVTTARWSLVPPFADSLTLKYPTFNARSETVTEKPTFRGSVGHQRAILPADAYYEWLTEGKVKTPHSVTSPEGELAFAALYSWWRAEPGSGWVLTATILTMPAPEPIAWLHDRTPVVLASEDWDWWLNRAATADQSFVDDAVSRSRPVAEDLVVREVAPLTGNGPHLLNPV
jgi:putative SOS response-associated peptidase YedK